MLVLVKLFNEIMVTITTTVHALAEWILARDTWAIEATPTGVTLYGGSATGRSVSATILGADLPRGLTKISGGNSAFFGSRDEGDLERRAQAIARWALRPLIKSGVVATLDWGAQSPHTSAFGRETLSSLGWPPAQRLRERIDALYETIVMRGDASSYEEIVADYIRTYADTPDTGEVETPTFAL